MPCDADNLWFNCLCKGLEAEGFIQSEINQSILLCDNCILLVYVDDVIAISNNVVIIWISLLKTSNMNIPNKTKEI